MQIFFVVNGPKTSDEKEIAPKTKTTEVFEPANPQFMANIYIISSVLKNENKHKFERVMSISIFLLHV